MNHWLLKTEPEVWSWAMQVKKGVEPWTGVRNFQAAAHLKAMRKGDQAFFYHTGDEKQVVGIVEVVREAYPDASDETGKFVAVDVKAVKPLTKPVTLAQIKATAALKDLLLVRHSRLSVSPVDPASWKLIGKMGGLAA